MKEIYRFKKNYGWIKSTIFIVINLFIYLFFSIVSGFFTHKKIYMFLWGSITGICISLLFSLGESKLDNRTVNIKDSLINIKALMKNNKIEVLKKYIFFFAVGLIFFSFLYIFDDMYPSPDITDYLHNKFSMGTLFGIFISSITWYCFIRPLRNLKD